MSAVDDLPPTDGRGAAAAASGPRAVLRRSLSRGPERGALAALFLFRTAKMATWVALLVWAFERHGTSGPGAIALAQLVPAALVAPLGSVLGDRLPHRRALQVGFAVQSLACVIAAVALADDGSFVVVCAAAALLGSSMALTRPVYYAMLPEIADGPEDLTALNSASVGVGGVADFVGPVVAAVLLTVSGAAWVMAVMAVVCAAAALVTLAVPSRPSRYGSNDEDGYAELLRSGVATLVRDRAATLLVLLVGVQYFVIGMLDVLGVVLALDVVGSGQGGPGLLRSALGIGAVIGASASVLLIGRRKLAPAIVLGACVAGAPIALASLASTLPSTMVLFAVAAAGAAFLGVAARTLTQRSVAPEILARVFGLQEALLLAGTAVGTTLATALVATLGTHGAFVAAGLFLPVTALCVWPWIRGLDERAVLPGASFVLLRGIPMFAMLRQAQLELLARELTPVEVVEGTAVVRQGEVGDSFFVVAEGSATVTVDGRQRRVLGPGSWFGEIALLHDVPRTATVTADTPMRLGRLARDTFLTVVTGTARSHAAARRHADELLVEGDDEA